MSGQRYPIQVSVVYVSSAHRRYRSDLCVRRGVISVTMTRSVTRKAPPRQQEQIDESGRARRGVRALETQTRLKTVSVSVSAGARG